MIEPLSSYSLAQDVSRLSGEFRINLPLRDVLGWLPESMRVSGEFQLGL